MDFEWDQWMIRREYSERATILRFIIRPFQIEIWIFSIYRMRERRRLALHIFSRLKSVFRGIDAAKIRHRDGNGMNWVWNDHRRPFENWPDFHLKTPAERLGFIVRMRRTELGFRLVDLAHLSGVHYTQLNRIEMGKVHPRLATLQALERALECELPRLPYSSKRKLNSTQAVQNIIEGEKPVEWRKKSPFWNQSPKCD